MPVIVHAADRCPWMNAATAGGLLGEDVTTRVTQTSCSFQSPRGALNIEVITKPSACPAATPLKAIGNEARLCDGVEGNERWAMVAGRVRDQFFTVRIRSAAAAAELREKARKAAETVAGNLF